MRNVILGLLIALCGCSTSSPTDDAGPDAVSDVAIDDATLDIAVDAPDVGTPDAEPADASECPVNCIRQVIRWGDDGGKVFERASYEVSECARVVREVQNFGGDPTTHCVAHIDVLQCGLVDTVASLLSNAEVMAAREAAPVLYGIDSRPVDGVVFQFRFEEGTISIGDPCRGGGGCIDVPEGIAMLRDALLALQQVADESAACETPSEDPARFSCRAGLGMSTIECLTGQEYCFTPFRCQGLPEGCTSCDCIPDAAAFECVEPNPGEIEVRWTE